MIAKHIAMVFMVSTSISMAADLVKPQDKPDQPTRVTLHKRSSAVVIHDNPQQDDSAKNKQHVLEKIKGYLNTYNHTGYFD